MEIGESKAVPCPDPRCVLSFDSMQDLQCHCQDVHCIERVKLDPIKRRRRTHQSSLNVKALPGAGVKLDYRCDFREESSFKHVNEIVNSPTLEPIGVIVSTGPVEPGERNSISRSCSLPSIDSITNQDKQGPSTASCTSSETLLSMTDLTSDGVALDKLTPTSSISSDLPLSIDPRLLDESDTRPIILPLSHDLVLGPRPKI